MAQGNPYDMTAETINIENLKTIAGASAAAMAMVYQDQAASRNRLNLIAEAATAKAIERLHSFDAKDAVAEGAILRAGSNADIGSLLSQLASGQIGVKAAVTTPPETGVSRQLADLGALLEVLKTVKGS